VAATIRLATKTLIICLSTMRVGAWAVYSPITLALFAKVPVIHAPQAIRTASPRRSQGQTAAIGEAGLIGPEEAPGTGSYSLSPGTTTESFWRLSTPNVIWALLADWATVTATN
jgi:hypothetical protein